MGKPRLADTTGAAIAGDCPDIEQHTACPSGYLAWHEWAEKMSKTHRQKRCPTCKLWVIWEPKEARHIQSREEQP